MMSPVVLIVGKDFRTEVLVAIDMNVTIRICLEFSHRTAIEVDAHTCWIFRFNVFYINLTCHRFVAILDGCITLTHLHTLHPTAWNIAQTVRESSTTKVRKVLGQHLNIRTTKTKEFDLFGSCCRI